MFVILEKNGECLNRGSIDKIWNGDTKPLDEDNIDNYHEIIAYKRLKKNFV